MRGDVDWAQSSNICYFREPENLRMNAPNSTRRWALLPQGLRGVFNLNDPRWGRREDKSSDDSRSEGGKPPPPSWGERGGRDSKPGGHPPARDELGNLALRA